MKLSPREFNYLPRCLQGFFFGAISILQLFSCLKLLKQSNINPTTGIYCDIFSMYLQLYASRNGPYRGRNILFYGLCVLYIPYVGRVLLLTQRLIWLKISKLPVKDVHIQEELHMDGSEFFPRASRFNFGVRKLLYPYEYRGIGAALSSYITKSRFIIEVSDAQRTLRPLTKKMISFGSTSIWPRWE